MKIKLSTLVASREALAALIAERLRMLPVLKIKRVAKAIEPELAVFDDTRKEILERMVADGTATLEKDKGIYRFVGDGQASFNSELEKIGDHEIDLPIEPIPLSDIWNEEEMETSSFSARHLMALEWLIVEPAEEKEPKKGPKEKLSSAATK